MEGRVAIGVIRNNEEFLVMKRSEETSSSGYWTFPGGKIKEDEDMEEAALREVKEEKGLEPEIIRTGDRYMNTGEFGEWKVFPSSWNLLLGK
jgi:mutator protein MutT